MALIEKHLYCCRSHDTDVKLKPLGNIVYNTNDARTHASYMLDSALGKTTRHLCVIPYEMFPPAIVAPPNRDLMRTRTP